MAATMAADPFEYTATGILGDKRTTMLQNQLLLRNELGRPSKRGYSNAPGGSYCYGRPNVVMDGGAAEALGGWPRNDSLTFHRKSNTFVDSNGGSKDFKDANRSAVLSGLTTAPENYQFRATQSQRPTVSEPGRKKSTSQRLLPSMTYGVATRPSTPVHDLLEHRYQDQWLQERQSINSSKQIKSAQRRVPGKVYETRASLLRIHQIPVKQGPLWHMPKFENKGRASLSSFRTDTHKTKAFQHYNTDNISRKGVIGQGTYEQAKS